jgi:hypothetical protein
MPAEDIGSRTERIVEEIMLDGRGDADGEAEWRSETVNRRGEG